jgi:hypothetical protein
MPWEILVAVTQPNVMAGWALHTIAMYVTVARMVAQQGVDIEENESWDKPQIHKVPVQQYMRKSKEGQRRGNNNSKRRLTVV